jgi:hypothetical protein
VQGAHRGQHGLVGDAAEVLDFREQAGRL